VARDERIFRQIGVDLANVRQRIANAEEILKSITHYTCDDCDDAETGWDVLEEIRARKLGR
jgi:hypothetical protein